jgi:nucleotide-binding universal stress UspA family protein
VETVKDGPSLILTAVDGTDTSLRAAACATGIARRDGARLIVMFVRDASMTPGPAVAITSLRESDAAMALELQGMAAERASPLGPDITFLDRDGDLYQNIVTTARQRMADLIVVGASMSLGHRLAGSLGVRLVKARLCPVLIVP